LIEAVWMVLHYWNSVSKVLNLQPFFVRIYFLIRCMQELAEAGLI
jgi:hypothetical protein